MLRVQSPAGTPSGQPSTQSTKFQPFSPGFHPGVSTKRQPGIDQTVGDLAVGEGAERGGDDAGVARGHERGERFKTAVADILEALEERTVHECFVRAHAERVPGEFKRAVEFGRGAFHAPFALPRVECGGEFCGFQTGVSGEFQKQIASGFPFAVAPAHCSAGEIEHGCIADPFFSLENPAVAFVADQIASLKTSGTVERFGPADGDASGSAEPEIAPDTDIPVENKQLGTVRTFNDPVCAFRFLLHRGDGTGEERTRIFAECDGFPFAVFAFECAPVEFGGGGHARSHCPVWIGRGEFEMTENLTLPAVCEQFRFGVESECNGFLRMRGEVVSEHRYACGERVVAGGKRAFKVFQEPAARGAAGGAGAEKFSVQEEFRMFVCKPAETERLFRLQMKFCTVDRDGRSRRFNGRNHSEYGIHRAFFLIRSAGRAARNRDVRSAYPFRWCW